MSSTLREVFSSLNFNEASQHVAFVKLLAYRNCFEIEGQENRLISEEEAVPFLEKEFDTLEDGVKWLKDVTQKKWLRATFQKEGIGKAIDPTFNLERWSILEQSVSSAEEEEFLNIFKVLNVIDAVEWPKLTIEHVVIHGGLENIAKERISFLDSFSGNLYYMTNPRGLFNNEASLADILAEKWFEKSELKEAIQTVLNKNMDTRSSNKHWLKDLSGLKKDILSAIGEEQWPLDKGWYYKNPLPFNQAAEAESRESLAGWPTAMDLVEYLFEQEKLKKPGAFEYVNLIPIYSVRSGRVANTEDNIEDFYNSFAKDFPVNTPIVFVSNNSLGLHYILFQDIIAKEVLKRLDAKPLQIITVGPAANKVNLSAVTDVFAKIFYTLGNALLKQLAYRQGALATQVGTFRAVSADVALEDNLRLSRAP